MLFVLTAYEFSDNTRANARVFVPLQVLKTLVLERYQEFSDAHEDGNLDLALQRLREAVRDFGQAALWYPLPTRRTYP